MLRDIAESRLAQRVSDGTASPRVTGPASLTAALTLVQYNVD